MRAYRATSAAEEPTRAGLVSRGSFAIVRRHSESGTMNSRRSRWFWIGALTAGVSSLLLFREGLLSLRVTDAQVAAGPPEDTLGWGIVPVLLFIGGPGVLALLWLWRKADRGVQRSVAAAETLFLMGLAVFAVWAHTLLRARVFK